MSARSKARKRALDLLYAADVRGDSALELLIDRLADTELTPLGDFAEGIVRGVVAHQSHIDQQISTYAIDWELDRMPAVDRAILRIAVFELVYGEPLDSAIIINEAVELAKSLSTDSSPSFVNGLLAPLVAVAAQLRSAATADDAN